MIKVITIFSILFYLSLPLYAQDGNPDSLEMFFKKRDFFKLRDQYLKVNMPVATRDFYRAFILNAFNDCRGSVEVIERINNNKWDNLKPGSQIALQLLQIDNYVKMYQYGRAAKVGRELLFQHAATIDSAKVAEIKNSNNLWEALQFVSPQESLIKKDATVRWKRDVAGLMNIPVTVDKLEEDFVFDTGANISTISESYAKKMHLHLIKSSFNVESSTSISNLATLAVATKLRIGAIILKNVVFIVLPDRQLEFPQINYKIHGIIGYPVISQLGEIHVRKAGTIIVKARPDHRPVNNMAMDELLPVILLKANNVKLPFSFDTGAKQTEFTARYFDRFKVNITKTGKPDSIKRAGAGGSVTYKVYKVPQVQFTVSGKTVNLDDIAITTEVDNSKAGFYYGNIGQDLVGKFDEMIIDFKKMYIDFR
jgi:predicted aspartyl protease